ncbi:hypothetical protein Tco_0801161 [Tanacetum coccineum]|uniref:Uncharacterized protein n=1 Tax=Tanacetum coccineum TaxID=301880 RepID=A0ABQ4ZZK1_9ASTR
MRYLLRSEDMMKLSLTGDESSDDWKKKFEKKYLQKPSTNIFDYETPICSAFNEFNYILKIMGWVICSDAVMESCDAILVFVFVTPSPATVDKFLINVGVVMMERLVKHSKRRAFWSLNKDILKITILKTNTPYPSRSYGVYVPTLTKDHRILKSNTPYPEDSIRRIQDMESI